MLSAEYETPVCNCVCMCMCRQGEILTWGKMLHCVLSNTALLKKRVCVCMPLRGREGERERGREREGEGEGERERLCLICVICLCINVCLCVSRLLEFACVFAHTPLL